MKTFQFRLHQVLRWRASQLDIEKARLAAAEMHLADLRNSVISLQSEMAAAAADRITGTTGNELVCLEGWNARTRRQITTLEAQQRHALERVESCRRALVEADRSLRLLQNLKATQHNRWTAEWNRELEAFAAESFLGKLQLENGRARSSVG